jgi:hypothetical protein
MLSWICPTPSPATSLQPPLDDVTVNLASGCDAVMLFVNDECDAVVGPLIVRPEIKRASQPSIGEVKILSQPSIPAPLPARRWWRSWRRWACG